MQFKGFRALALPLLAFALLLALVAWFALRDPVIAAEWNVTLRPKDPRAHVRLGDVLFEHACRDVEGDCDAGELGRACRAYEAAGRLDPASVEANVGVGFTRSREDPAGAAAALERALELKRDQPETHVKLAVIYENLGRLDLARKHYRATLALEPDHPLAAYGLKELRAGEIRDAGVSAREVEIAPGGRRVAVLFTEDRTSGRARLLVTLGKPGGGALDLGVCDEAGVRFHPDGSLWFFKDGGPRRWTAERGVAALPPLPDSLVQGQVGRLNWSERGELLLAVSGRDGDSLAQYSPRTAKWQTWRLPERATVSFQDHVLDLGSEDSLVAVSRERDALIRLRKSTGACEVAAGPPESSRFRWVSVPPGGAGGELFEVDPLGGVQFMTQADGRGMWLAQSHHTDMNFHGLRPVDLRRREVGTEQHRLMGKPQSLDQRAAGSPILCSISVGEAPHRQAADGTLAPEPFALLGNSGTRRPLVDRPLSFSVARWLPPGDSFVLVTGPAESPRVVWFDRNGRQLRDDPLRQRPNP